MPVQSVKVWEDDSDSGCAAWSMFSSSACSCWQRSYTNVVRLRRRCHASLPIRWVVIIVCRPACRNRKLPLNNFQLKRGGRTGIGNTLIEIDLCIGGMQLDVRSTSARRCSAILGRATCLEVSAAIGLPALAFFWQAGSRTRQALLKRPSPQSRRVICVALECWSKWKEPYERPLVYLGFEVVPHNARHPQRTGASWRAC